MEGHFRDLLTKKRTTTRLKPPTLTKVTYVVVEDGRDKIRFKQCSKLLFAEYSSNTLSIPELKSAILKDHTRRQKSEGRVCDDRCVKLYLSVRGQEITDVSDLPKLFKYTTPLYAEFKKPITVSPEMDLTSRLKRELDTDACVDLEWTNTQIQPQRPAKKARQPCSDVYQHSQYIPRNVRVVPENLNSLIVEAGNDIPSNIPTIECFRLSIVTKQWVKNEDFSGRIDFDKNDSHFVGEGGFRKCYKAKVFTDLGTKDVAVKFFSERGKNRLRDFFALDEQSSLDMEQAINRDIQVNESSMNLAAVFNSKVPANWSIFFNPSYFGKMKDKEGTEELCFVEPLLKGSFWRAISNNGEWEICNATIDLFTFFFNAFD